jgi:hypothetical protein
MVNFNVKINAGVLHGVVKYLKFLSKQKFIQTKVKIHYRNQNFVIVGSLEGLRRYTAALVLAAKTFNNSNHD